MDRLSEYETVWWNCCCEIICACGDHVILSDDGEPCLCGCGRVWSLETRLRCRKIEDVVEGCKLSEAVERGAARGALIRRMMMPNRMVKACSYPGCTELVVKGRCEKHREAEVYYRDKGRQALYDRSWRIRRSIQLEDKPWCEDCWEKGIVTVATDVHHENRHEGNVIVFLKSSLRSLCKACHTKRTMEERAG